LEISLSSSHNSPTEKFFVQKKKNCLIHLSKIKKSQKPLKPLSKKKKEKRKKQLCLAHPT